jgi:cell shape-determining protein MreD
MATLIAFPILGIAVILQTAILSRVPLLQGPADLVLLTLVSWVLHDEVKSVWPWALLAGLLIGWISALPFWIPVLTYFGVTSIALLLRNRLWQVPILALFTTIFLGTLINHGVAYLSILVGGTTLDWREAFNLIILPSVLLNLLLAIPVNGVVSEIAHWLYPQELEA